MRVLATRHEGSEQAVCLRLPVARSLAGLVWLSASGLLQKAGLFRSRLPAAARPQDSVRSAEYFDEGTKKPYLFAEKRPSQDETGK
ncbi:hypothetical protein CSOJ01_02000 [Colletotrichum sojae]|uniref:Uncharacterized protein n=1 Tax=Colletotrichum sojae TaxID=2175907 RepID=A0A8H6N2P3_9PEZI|nr:hypothetical protein CSOJ01_02000 [Colletotrichum sojae]